MFTPKEELQLGLIELLEKTIETFKEGAGHQMAGVSSSLTIRHDLALEYLKEVPIVRNRQYEMVYEKSTREMRLETRFPTEISTGFVKQVELLLRHKVALKMLLDRLSEFG